MGIRFYCPNGHKLNVKTFLAGKRGICPRCGAKLEIPAESVRAPSGRKKRSKTKLAQSLAASHEAAATRREALVRPELVAAGIQTDATPASSPFGSTAGAPAEQVHISAIESESAIRTNSQVGSAISKAAIVGPIAAIDPIAESPTAIWYVRPAAGGQFGPAAGDIMRQWLAQRRVGADSMVWREAWADWKRADAVFPLLFPATAANATALPALAPATVPAATSPTTNFADDADWVGALVDPKSAPEIPPPVSHPLSHAPRHKQKTSNTIVIVSFFLILLCVLLVAVMITAYFHQKSETSDTSTSMLPARSSGVAKCPAEPSIRPLVPASTTA